MANEKDVGFGEKFNSKEKRLINKDGSFNVVKQGSINKLRDTYSHLLEMSWSKFILFLFLAYFSLNVIFALLYFILGVENLIGADRGGFFIDFMSCLYFSTQTFTTVGYGTISPKGIPVNLIASIEAMVGLLSFSLATGLLFGRFSKPNLKLVFSENALISDYTKNNGKGLMFKLANKRNSVLLETSIQVIATYNISENGSVKRGYSRLELELSEVKMLPSQWTVVHPLNEESLFRKFTIKELIEMKLELLVLVNSVEETYSHPVFARTSYKAEEIIENANFKKTNTTGADGSVLIDLDAINEYEFTN